MNEIPTKIQLCLDELSKHKEYILGLIEPYHLAVSIVVQLWPKSKTDVSVNYGGSRIKGVCIHLNGMANPAEVAPILRALAAEGYRLKDKPKHTDWCQRLHWDCGVIQVLGFFNSKEPNACQFIEIGEKTEKQYKLVCPGGSGELNEVSDAPTN